jgi:hypothetical protein
MDCSSAPQPECAAISVIYWFAFVAARRQRTNGEQAHLIGARQTVRRRPNCPMEWRQ